MKGWLIKKRDDISYGAVSTNSSQSAMPMLKRKPLFHKIHFKYIELFYQVVFAFSILKLVFNTRHTLCEIKDHCLFGEAFNNLFFFLFFFSLNESLSKSFSSKDNENTCLILESSDVIGSTWIVYIFLAKSLYLELHVNWAITVAFFEICHPIWIEDHSAEPHY